MRVHRVVLRELVHYRWNSAAGLVAIMLAVAAIAGTAMVLGAYESDAAGELDAREARLHVRLAELRADVDRAMGELGFNLTILPQGQDPADWYAQDEASPTMAETDVQRLIEAGVGSVRNPVGQLRRRVTWPETKWSVVVVGREVRQTAGPAVPSPRSNGEPAAAPGEPAPLAARYLQPPRPGSVALGHEIHRVLGYREGDEIRFMGRTLRVDRCLPQEGSRDDIAVTMALGEAQELLEEPGRISEIVAQGTRSALEDLAGLREQIAGVLPGTQVVQNTPQTVAATLADVHVHKSEHARLEQERAVRAELNRHRRQLAGLVNLLVVASCGLWVGWLAWNNVAERRAEIGVWRACGLRARRLVVIFLGRWVVLGAAGTVAGLAAVAPLASWPAGVSSVQPGLLAATLGVAFLLSGLAATIAALAAAREDPAAAFRAG